MFGSIFLIYLIHYAKAKVNDSYTIESNSTIPIAITIPFLESEEAVTYSFLTNVIQMELKGILQEKNILVISSYDAAEDHLFHSKNLAIALSQQGRNVLVIDATGKLKDKIGTIDYLDYSNLKYLSFTKIAFQNDINERVKKYDLCIINNQAVKEEKLSLLFMSLASNNLFILDSKKTAEKTIIKVELLKNEYQLPNMWFVLNKANFHPSIFVELKKHWNNYQLKKQSA